MTPARIFLFLLVATVTFGQADTGELQLFVTDPSGSPVQASVELASEVNEYNRTFDADAAGKVVAKRLPFGLYTVTISRAGFATSNNSSTFAPHCRRS